MAERLSQLLVASAVARTTGPSFVSTVLPSICFRRSSRSEAIRSITFASSASSAESEALSRMAFSTHTALRLRVLAMLLLWDTRSLTILAEMTSCFSLPFSFLSPFLPGIDINWTGWAEPMLVLGAIAATCAAMVMKRPADAARAPRGLTKTTTGRGELRIILTIS